MGFKRKQYRADVGRTGRIQRGPLSAPCKVLDISESGVRIESRMYVKVGDTLELVMDLDHGGHVACTIQPIHVQAPCFGARITVINFENKERLSEILDDRVQRVFFSR